MPLLTSVRVEGFRSIRDAELEGLGDFSVLAGVNNAGKSNFLRALNAFFNEETEPGIPLRLDDDYARGDRSKRKKAIRIRVAFQLPASFRFRQELAAAKSLVGATPVVTKEWVREDTRPRYYLGASTHPLGEADRERVDQFLGLMTFRYVPNRVLPLDLIRNQHNALRDVIIRRVGSSAGAKEREVFKKIGEASERLVKTVAANVKDATAGIEKVRLATPQTLAEMVFAFGYRVTESGQEFPDTVQGSGLQSLLLLQTLYLIDRDYFQKFGWKQAAVWALEEPESSLHVSLEARIADFLRDTCGERTTRLQVLSTSHSDFMIQYANAGWLVEKQGSFSSATALPIDELLDKSSAAGVIRWVDPLLRQPTVPVVLVEGAQDAALIERGLELVGEKGRCRVTYLKLLGDAAPGGVDAMYKYLGARVQALRARSASAPVVVLLDWDAAARRGAFQQLAPNAPGYKVVAWDENDANPKLGKSFRGMERFMSQRIIDEARKRGAPIAKKDNGDYVVAADEREPAKNVINDVIKSGITDKDLRYVRKCLANVIAAL